MDIHFDEELKLLKKKLLNMADHAQEMINLSVESLRQRDIVLANEVFKVEENVNRIEVEIEEEVLRLLARRQPAAKDLRLLIALLKINTDLERVADQACNISNAVTYLLQEPPISVPLVDIPNMARLSQKMVRGSIDAFVNHDVALAKEICAHDDEVDWINSQTFRVLLTYMMENPKAITRCVDLLLISRNLERIADHATNISEEVIFIEEGKNVKHHLQDEKVEG